MKREVKNNQRGCRVFNVIVDGTASTPAVTGPDKQIITLLSDVGTGNQTFTLGVASIDAAHVVVQCTCITAGKVASVSVTSASVIDVKTYTPSTGAAVDAIYQLTVWIYDCADYFGA